MKEPMNKKNQSRVTGFCFEEGCFDYKVKQ